MKTQFQKNRIDRLSYFYKEKNVTTAIAWLLIIAILNLSVSCSYFNVRSVPTTKENMTTQIKAFNESRKYVIIHSNDVLWHLDNMVINEDDQAISGTILPINAQHQYKRIRERKRVHS